MNDETKKAIASASDALEAISYKISTAAELTAIALEEAYEDRPKMRTIEVLLNVVIDALSDQSSELQHWSIELDRIERSENK